jgi:hypothetical protein
MRRVGRHRLKRLGHHFGDFVIPDLARCATARFIVKTIEASESKSLAPCHDRHPAGADFLRNCAIIQTIRSQKDNLGAHRICVRDFATPHAPFQFATLPLAENDRHCSWARHCRLRIMPIREGIMPSRECLEISETGH